MWADGAGISLAEFQWQFSPLSRHSTRNAIDPQRL